MSIFLTDPYLIVGFVIDQYELEKITKTRLAKLKKSLWVLQGIYDFEKVFAAGFYNLWRRERSQQNQNLVITAPYLAINWRKCLDTYMSFNVAKQGLKEYELRIRYGAIVSINLPTSIMAEKSCSKSRAMNLLYCLLKNYYCFN